ncbi:hypothetical protein [Vibrio caribbeanicus]|uniref:hypothetical protein n=1 Tax=Vibrio caribbeanicus TaxID=701175 RepID=UPI0022835621|nr:hypothetical protein [Vibrio caribbeanicus]MCY9845562.1 hypothetical protein [Vibrio caribbeanicus]
MKKSKGKDLMQPCLRKWTHLGIIVVLIGCSGFDLDKAPGHYPTLGLATFSDASVQLANSPNIVKSAIEHNEFVKIKNIDKVNRYIPRIFAEANLNEVVSINDLKNAPFHSALELIVKQFTCELYASMQPSNSVQFCPRDRDIVTNNLGYLPFKDGVRHNHRLVIEEKDANSTLHIELFLRSTLERPFESVWGAVHELGYFKGSRLDPESLVLTINLNAYKKSSKEHNWHLAHSEPLVFFVIIPTVKALTQRPNEMESMDYAYRSARILVVDSRPKQQENRYSNSIETFPESEF